MSDETKITEREAVLRERAAVVAACHELQLLSGGAITGFVAKWEGSLRLAARLFPLSVVTRRRFVVDPAEPFASWSVAVHGGLVRVIAGSGFGRAPMGNPWPTPERVKLWVDLLAFPDETVEDAGDYEIVAKVTM